MVYAREGRSSETGEKNDEFNPIRLQWWQQVGSTVSRYFFPYIFYLYPPPTHPSLFSPTNQQQKAELPKIKKYIQSERKWQKNTQPKRIVSRRQYLGEGEFE